MMKTLKDTIEDPLPKEMLDELKAIKQPLKALQDKLRALPGWRASLGVEMLDEILKCYSQGVFDLMCVPRPAYGEHWGDIAARWEVD